MKHLKTFDQINESAVTDALKALLDMLSKKDTKPLAEALMPYRNLLKPYYDKYCIGGVIRADLIEADIRSLSFSANEGWDSRFLSKGDYADDKKNPMLLRVLYKIFARLPKELVYFIGEWFGDIFSAFRRGEIFMGILGIGIAALAAIVVFVLGHLAYQFGDHMVNGLQKGIAKGGAVLEPAHYQTHTHTYRSGGSAHTYTTRDYVPDRWHVEVQGIGEESDRAEEWITYDGEIADEVWKGDTLDLDKSWSWESTEEY